MYKILIKAYEDMVLTQLECENESYSDYYLGMLKKLENIIIDYVTDMKLSNEEMLKDLEELGACSPMSILNDMYNELQDNE